MELSQLRYFLEVAKNQHVTKSAENLHIAQPALSRSIHSLEEELGVPLFTPKGRNIILTPYGEFFNKNLIPIMKELTELPEHLRTIANLENSTIHLNVLAASALVTEAIIEYQRIDESLHVKLTQNEEINISDICVTTRLFYQEPVVKHDSIFICTEKIYLAVPNAGRYKTLKSIKLREVKNEDFISLLGSKQLRSICDKYCANAGISPNIIFESDSPAAVKNMIGSNMGVGFWPEFSWGSLKTDKVKLLEIEEPVCSRDILITYGKHKQDNTTAEAFYQYLIKYFKMAAAQAK